MKNAGERYTRAECSSTWTSALSPTTNRTRLRPKVGEGRREDFRVLGLGGRTLTVEPMTTRNALARGAPGRAAKAILGDRTV
jgi:hypothetical protein